MKETYRESIINFGKNERWSFKNEINGNIVYVAISETNTLYVLTDCSFFYVLEKGKKESKEFALVPSFSQDPEKYTTMENNSQIWCDRLGNHVIIKHDKRVFYFNPTFDDGPKEINLERDYKYLEPYAVAFNENNTNSSDTQEILFSDFESDIYTLQIQLNKKEPTVKYDLVFNFNQKDDDDDAYFNKEENYGFDFKLFTFEKNERIIDMKVISNNYTDKLILAITKNVFFQFEGRGTYKEILANYSVENGGILKAYKKFSTNSKENEFEKSRIQLCESYSSKSVDKDNLQNCFGFISSCGYCLGDINNDDLSINNFIFYNYIKQKKDGSKDFNAKPIMVCHSKLHIFFLYDDCLMIVNKLSTNTVQIENTVMPYIDIFYHKTMNSLILYTSKDIYKLNLDGEDKYIWENYIEIGNYNLALKSLPESEKALKPKLHKLNAEKLFNEKNYEKAAMEYALSDEIFENICFKFLMKNETKGLLKYLSNVKNLKLDNVNKQNKNFVKLYLIYTWIVELLVDTGNDGNLHNFIEETKHNHTDKYIDKIVVYFLLKNYGKSKEFLDYAKIKGDYELIIQEFINHFQFVDVLNNLEKFMSSDIDDAKMQKLTKILFEYSGMFMKESPIKTINLLQKDFIGESSKNDIIKALIDLNLKDINDQDYETILEYMRKLINKNNNNINDTGENDENISMINNLHNLYILFLSQSKKPEHQKEVIEYLKTPLNNYTSKNNYLNVSISNKKIYIDLNFAQKILQNNHQALALVYCLMGRFNESIMVALQNNEKDIAIFIAQNIQNDKIKKDIWLRIFKYFKTNNFADAKNILESSNGVLKIEDILPFMMDNVKLEELKTDLQSCINYYEDGVNQLKQEINDYNKSTEIIKQDIIQIKKKSTFINYTQLKCEKCQKDIKGNKFFLFPCGHIFDTNCLIRILIDYDKKNIGDSAFKSKIGVIKELREKIVKLQQKKQKIKNEQNSQSTNTFSVLLNFMNKEQKEEFSKEEEKELVDLNYNLYKLLKEECVLCGKEMISSTQIKLGEDDNKKWADLI